MGTATSTIRKAAFVTAAIALVAFPSSKANGQQQPLTKEECRAVAAVAGVIVKSVGANNLSVDFRQSFRNWLGADITCDGPKDIIIKTAADSDAFVTIRGALGAASRPIDIMTRGGLRAVAPAQ